MIENKSNIKIEVSSERNFGIVFSIFFLLLGIYAMKNNVSNFIFIFLISFIFIFLGIFFPKILNLPNKLWFKFGLLLGLLISPFIMAFIFFLTVVPIGLILKLMRKDLLNQKIDKSQKTYWIPRKNQLNSMKDQF